MLQSSLQEQCAAPAEDHLHLLEVSSKFDSAEATCWSFVRRCRWRKHGPQPVAADVRDLPQRFLQLHVGATLKSVGELGKDAGLGVMTYADDERKAMSCAIAAVQIVYERSFT